MIPIPDGFQQESNRTPSGFPVRENMCARLRDQRTENKVLPDPSMNATVPRATTEPVDNLPAVPAMDGADAQDVPLFDGYEPPAAEPVEHLSAGQRLTRRQAADIRQGIHPLTLAYTLIRPLHPDADRGRTASSPQDGTPTCGTCAYRQVLGHHTRSYPKCAHPSGPISHSPATDVRAWWPACITYQPKEDQ